MAVSPSETFEDTYRETGQQGKSSVAVPAVNSGFRSSGMSFPFVYA
jgi:hypothetical protein